MRKKQWIPPVAAAHPLLSKKRTCTHAFINYHEVFVTGFPEQNILEEKATSRGFVGGGGGYLANKI